VYEVK